MKPLRLRWKKLGRIFSPQRDLWWNQTHMSLPTVEILQDSHVRMFFGGRDYLNRSRIGYTEFDLENLEETAKGAYCKEPVLDLGDLGTFDDNGVMPCSVVDNDEEKYLYYVGWNPKSTVRFSFFSGLAIAKKDLSFIRHSKAPLLERTNIEPYVNASPFVLKDDDLWRMYYVSGEGWITPDLPKYNIKYAESKDGLNWVREGDISIDFSYPGEHALARPYVMKENGLYHMWFSYKGNDYDLEHNYRLGYAFSKEGKNFQRMDDNIGIDVSPDGWDSEMIAYAAVIKNKEKYYMFYNGNNYGQGGIGLAIGTTV